LWEKKASWDLPSGQAVLAMPCNDTVSEIEIRFHESAPTVIGEMPGHFAS